MKRVSAILCGAHRWDGREYLIGLDELSKPIVVDVEMPPEQVAAGTTMAPLVQDRFMWDGTVDVNGRHRFRKEQPAPA